MIDGKKVDIKYDETIYGKQTNVFCECKDYSKPLNRNQVSNILSDYSSLLHKNIGSKLLIITRHGLSSSAGTIVDGNPSVFHSDIWSLENELFNLLSYVEIQNDNIKKTGLNNYFLPPSARFYTSDKGKLKTNRIDLMSYTRKWIDQEGAQPPFAILGGYGAGKSSFAQMLFMEQSNLCIENPTERRPVLIKLGDISRSSSLDGLLGTIFTSQIPTKGYSFDNFMKMNNNGRLLIILDGFDEMKFAMSWEDFKYEISQLNTLVSDNARVILLGRPTAFLSDGERLHILKGQRQLGKQLLAISGWPKFFEIEVDDFDKTKVADFITNYSSYLSQKNNISEDKIRERVELIKDIALQSIDLFAKPVHSKILVEIASLSKISLDGIIRHRNRWELYQAFFSHLIEREVQKTSRRNISEEDRLKFLRRLSFWLWSEKDGSISFQPSAIPLRIYDDFCSESEDQDAVLRELLIGSFVERKAGNTYFFVHRSFCEFLVSQHVIANVPSASDHTIYSKVLNDGVQEFLREFPDEVDFESWAVTIPAQNVVLNPSYLIFLAERLDKLNIEYSKLENDVWLPIISVFSDRFGTQPERLEHAVGLLKVAPALSCACLIMLIVPGGIFNFRPEEISQKNVVYKIAANLISNLFRYVREDNGHSKVTISDQEGEELLQLIRPSIVGPDASSNGRIIRTSWTTLLESAEKVVKRANVNLSLNRDTQELDPKSIFELSSVEVSRFIPSGNGGMAAKDYLSPSGRNNLDAVAVVTHIRRKNRPPSK